MDRFILRIPGLVSLAAVALFASSAGPWPFDPGPCAFAQTAVTGPEASDQHPPADASYDGADLTDPTDSSAADSVHATIAGGVTGFGAWLDSFFSTEHHETENNKTRVRVLVGGSAEEGSDPSLSLKVKAKLALPHINKRLSLVASGDGDNASDVQNTANDDVREHYDGTDKQNVAVGLEYLIKGTETKNIGAVVGLRVRDSIPVGVFGGRYRQTLDLDPWRLRFTQEALWFTDNGFSLPSRLDFDRPVTDSVLSRTTLRGDWYESEDGYYYQANQALIQRLGPRRAVSYEWNNHFRTKPSNRLEETNLRVRYRQAVWRDWLIFDIAPQLSFPRDRDFDATPGIYAGFEIRFGG